MSNIRKATVADINILAKLATQLGYPSTPEQIEPRLKTILANKSHIIFVYEIDKVIVGWIFAFIALRLSSDAYSEIGGLVVDEQMRGYGIGKKLVAVAEQWSKDNGIYRLRVRSNVIRLETHKFYEHLGFEDAKLQKVFKKNLR